MVTNLILILFYVFQSDGYGKKERLGSGYRCAKNKYTFMVAIIQQTNDSINFVGGGTLLSERWVLTTALHLRNSEAVKNYMVVAGITHLSEFYSKSKLMQSSLVEKSISSMDIIIETLDIALLRLAQPISKSKSVSYVRLAKAKDIKGKKLKNICANATVVGYGNRRDDKDLVFNKSARYCAQVPVISKKECKKHLPYFPLPVPQQGCIFRPDINICYGDTGGPVICNGIQYGVIAATYACGAHIPSIFSRIDGYEEFLKSKLRNINNKESKCSSNNLVNLYLLVLLVFLYLVTNHKFY